MRHYVGRWRHDVLDGSLEVSDDGLQKEEVVCCNTLWVVFGEVVSVFFELVLLLLSGLVDEFLLSLSLFLVLG